MIHLSALPGTPANGLSLSQIEKQALHEAKVFRAAGVHGVMLENMHDTPYLRGRVGPEIVASMAIIARAVKQVSGLPAQRNNRFAPEAFACAVSSTGGSGFQPFFRYSATTLVVIERLPSSRASERAIPTSPALEAA